MDEFSSSVRVRTVSRDRAVIYARGHRFEAGAPVHFDEQYERVTALEYLLGAVGADIANGLQSLCRQRRVQVDDIEVVVRGELDNPLVYLGVVGEEGNPGLEALSVKAYVASSEPEATVRLVWEEMLKRSPLVQTFRASVDLALEMNFIV